MMARHGARTRRATIRTIVIQMRGLRMKKTWQKRPYVCKVSARKSSQSSLLPGSRTQMPKMVMKEVLRKRER